MSNIHAAGSDGHRRVCSDRRCRLRLLAGLEAQASRQYPALQGQPLANIAPEDPRPIHSEIILRWQAAFSAERPALRGTQISLAANQQRRRAEMIPGGVAVELEIAMPQFRYVAQFSKWFDAGRS